jgi:hypothetical protein
VNEYSEYSEFNSVNLNDERVDLRNIERHT